MSAYIPTLKAGEIEQLPVVMVFVDQRFVFIGHIAETLQSIQLYRPVQLRKWTTGCGVGPIAQGDLTHATLDALPPVSVPRHSIIWIAQCAPSWIDQLRRLDLLKDT